MSTSAHLHIIKSTLTPRPPFDFTKTLGFLQGFGPTGGEQALAVGSLTKAVTLHGRAVAFELQNAGTIEEPQISYTLYSEQPLSEAEHAAIADRLRFFLSLDDDLQPFYHIGRADPSFAPVIELSFDTYPRQKGEICVRGRKWRGYGTPSTLVNRVL